MPDTVEPIARPHRTAAHAKAIHRAWAKRAANRVANAELRTQRSRTRIAEAALRDLRAGLADPNRPERLSEVGQLRSERDEARAALRSLEQRQLIMQRQLDADATVITEMGVRMARMKADATRAQGAGGTDR